MTSGSALLRTHMTCALKILTGSIQERSFHPFGLTLKQKSCGCDRRKDDILAFKTTQYNQS